MAETKYTLEQVEEMLKTLTPGPWKLKKDDCAHCGYELYIYPLSTGRHAQFGKHSERDAEFIASAPEIVAWLVGEVERLSMDLTCDICGGVQKSVDKPCACNGTGSVRVAFQYCLGQLFEVERQLAIAREALEFYADQDDFGKFAEDSGIKAEEALRRMGEENNDND